MLAAVARCERSFWIFQRTNIATPSTTATRERCECFIRTEIAHKTRQKQCHYNNCQSSGHEWVWIKSTFPILKSSALAILLFTRFLQDKRTFTLNVYIWTHTSGWCYGSRFRNLCIHDCSTRIFCSSSEFCSEFCDISRPVFISSN